MVLSFLLHEAYKLLCHDSCVGLGTGGDGPDGGMEVETAWSFDSVGIFFNRIIKLITNKWACQIVYLIADVIITCNYVSCL